MKAAERLIPFSLELGGKNPMVVLEGAPLEDAAAGLLAGAFTNSGQTCIAVERVYVEESIFEKFVRSVVEKTAALKLGWSRSWDMKILVAEDDQDSRELLTWLLQKLGHQVQAAPDGKEAWNAFRKGRFRIVISDVLMPEIDGLELCRRIRSHKQSKYTYIIIITALIGKKDYLEGM